MGGQQQKQFSSVLTEIDTAHYEPQLDAKAERIRAQFAQFAPPELEIFRSQPVNYRMRTEFRVWHEDEDVYYVMYDKDDKGERRQVRVDAFPVASLLVNQLMAAVRTSVLGEPALRRKLFQATFHTTLSGQAMVSLIYHRKLDDDWSAAAGRLRAALALVPGATAPPSVIGRSKNQKVVLGADEVEECLTVAGMEGQLRYVQVEASFSQPNAGTCQNMLSWARAVTAGSTEFDMLELYCGNGNFTVALAPNFRRVVATEVSKTGVAAAKRNFELNGVSNVFVARMSSEEFTEAWKEGRAMKRLEGLDLAAADFRTLLVDPPRAGLDPQTLQLLHDFENVVYVSCNPETLHANLAAVADVFEVKKFAMFDQFPYTHHVECGVYLQRRPGAPPPRSATAAAAAAAAAVPVAVPAAAAAAAEDADGRGLKRKSEEDAAVEEGQ